MRPESLKPMDRGLQTGQPARLAVMLSGSGRTLANLIDSIGTGRLSASIVLVIASRECGGAEIARRHLMPVVVEKGDIASDRLAELLREHRVEWIALAGYLRRVDIPCGFSRRTVNIHPALLPAFGGPGMYGLRVHRAVLESGSRESGCTVHLCDSEYDRGPIILQQRCPVEPGDTPESLAERVFMAECEAYPRALELLIAGRVRVEGNRAVILPA